MIFFIVVLLIAGFILMEVCRQQSIKASSYTCLICGKPFGEPICENCIERSKVLINELPKNKTGTYEALNEYKKELIFEIITTDDEFKRKTDSVKLLSVADILQNKYYEEEAYKDAYTFLWDMSEHDTEYMREKYLPVSDSKPQEYTCKDGDTVKSKGEREIDNFFFDNGIRHIYEAQYKHPGTGRLARPDFYLPEYNLYIEYFGLYGNEAYLKNKDEKIAMYLSDKSIRFEYLTYEDDNFLFDKLKSICQKYSIPTKNDTD